MDTKTTAILQECTKRSDENSISFPEVVAKLMHAGVERYHADLRRSERTFYMPNGESFIVGAHPVEGDPAQTFSADDVAAAVKTIQQGKIDYAEFCRRIVAAGCIDYIVSITGSRTTYFGRSGDNYVERFPRAAWHECPGEIVIDSQPLLEALQNQDVDGRDKPAMTMKEQPTARFKPPSPRPPSA